MKNLTITEDFLKNDIGLNKNDPMVSCVKMRSLPVLGQCS